MTLSELFDKRGVSLVFYKSLGFLKDLLSPLPSSDEDKEFISLKDKDRARDIASKLEIEPDPDYDQSWESLNAEVTSDYTKSPENWKQYESMLPLKIKQSAIKARKFLLKRLKLSREQASGIVGVLISETNLNPNSYNKSEKTNKKTYGAGIGSWTSPDIKKRIKEMLKGLSGLDKGEIENYNLDELLEAYALDLENHPGILNLLKQTTTVDDAADIVTRGIENGGMSGNLVTKDWFNKNYTWINGSDEEGNKYDNHYLAAMYNTDYQNHAIGRAIAARITYNLT